MNCVDAHITKINANVGEKCQDYLALFTWLWLSCTFYLTMTLGWNFLKGGCISDTPGFSLR